MSGHDDDFGIIGDIRVFSADGVEWRAFEYRSPGHAPRETSLVLMADGVSCETDHYPADWDALPAERLADLASALPHRPIRRSTPADGVATQAQP